METDVTKKELVKVGNLLLVKEKVKRYSPLKI